MKIYYLTLFLAISASGLSQSQKFNFDMLNDKSTELTTDQYNLLKFYFCKVDYNTYYKKNQLGERVLINPYLDAYTDQLGGKYLDHIRTKKIGEFGHSIDYEYYEKFSLHYILEQAKDYLAQYKNLRLMHSELKYKINSIIGIDYQQGHFADLNSDNVLTINATLINFSDLDIASVFGVIVIYDERENRIFSSKLNSINLPRSTVELQSMSFKQYKNRVEGNFWLSLSLSENWKFRTREIHVQKIKNVNLSNCRLEYIPEKIIFKNGHILRK